MFFFFLFLWRFVHVIFFTMWNSWLINKSFFLLTVTPLCFFPRCIISAHFSTELSHYCIFHIFRQLSDKCGSLCSEVFRAVYHAYRFWSEKVGWVGRLELSYLCLWLLSFLHENRRNSQILSLSLLCHLGNSNLYLQSVGGGGQHEILKSTSPCSPSPRPSGPASPPSVSVKFVGNFWWSLVDLRLTAELITTDSVLTPLLISDMYCRNTRS